MHFGCLFVYMQKDSMEVVQEKTAYFWRRRKTLRETRKKEDERVMTEEVGRVVHDGLAASLLLPLCLCCLRGDAGIWVRAGVFDSLANEDIVAPPRLLPILCWALVIYIPSWAPTQRSKTCDISLFSLKWTHHTQGTKHYAGYHRVHVGLDAITKKRRRKGVVSVLT